MTVENPRLYTGEFPPNGSATTADEIVAGLMESVNRARIKYAIAAEALASKLGADVEDVMAWVDSQYDVEADARMAMHEARQKESAQ